MGDWRAWPPLRPPAPWSAAAIERTARALAAWARRAEPPDWDPERHGQWANAIAELGPAEKKQRVAYELERARRAFWWQRMMDLADARGYPLAVVQRAARLLNALDASGVSADGGAPGARGSPSRPARPGSAAGRSR